MSVFFNQILYYSSKIIVNPADVTNMTVKHNHVVIMMIVSLIVVHLYLSLETTLFRV